MSALREGSTIQGENMQRALIAAWIGLGGLAATPAPAQEAHSWTVEDDFANVTFALESAIVGAGLVIDHTSHTGEMLERTREATGSQTVIFTQADIYSFCSATVSRLVMEANPANVQFCPYTVFAYETPGQPGVVTVGFRDYPAGEMDQVEAMLGGIVTEALMLEP